MEKQKEKSNIKNETNLKGKGGITLIALVITIVVLLILAAVSIATLTGQNGILTQANTAKTKTEEAGEKEAIGIAYNGVMADRNGVDAEKLEKELNNYGYNASASGNIKVYFEDSKRWYKVDSNGNITGPYESEDEMGTGLVELFLAGQNCQVENCQDETHLHVGDYVLYTPEDSNASTASLPDNPLQTQYTGYSEGQEYKVDQNIKWRVLGLNEEKTQVLLISESPIKKEGEEPYLVLQGAEGYIYGEKVLNGVCSIYSNSSLEAEARSMTMDDITNALGITVDKQNNVAHNKEGEQLQDMQAYQGFFGVPYNYQQYDYAPENYMIEKYGEDLKIELEEKAIGSSAKNIDESTGEDNSAYMVNYGNSSVVDPNSKIYDILFSGTTQTEGYAKSYWLASSGVYVATEYGDAYFGPGCVYGGYAAAGGTNLFNSVGDCNAGRFAVRPVVSLGSDISDGDIDIIRGSEYETSPEEDIWAGVTNNRPFQNVGQADAGQIIE